MTNTTTAPRTILNDSDVRAEVAHYWCCTTPSRGRYFVRTQMVTAAAVRAVDDYGATADTPELDKLVRSVRHWTRRFRNAVAAERQGTISPADYVKVERGTEFALQALGTYVCDAFYTAAGLRCHLHPHNVHEATRNTEPRTAA